MAVHLDLQLAESCLQAYLREILQFATEAANGRSGAVFLATDDGRLYCGSRYRMSPGCGDSLSLARWTLANEKPLSMDSPEQASRLLSLPVMEKHLFPLVCVPIQNGGDPVGVLQVNALAPLGHNKGSRQDLHIIELAAKAIAHGLEKDRLRRENKRLQREIASRDVHLLELVRHTIEIEEAERERISLDVHDGVAQTLASAFQYLQALEESIQPQGTQLKHMHSRAVALVRQAIQEARDVINSITPATLNDIGLVRTLEQEMRQMEKETRCQVDFRSDWPRLDRDMEVALYRVIREAITNARKHSSSDRIDVRLKYLPDCLMAQITDWGVGFDLTQQEAASKRGFGLFSMRKRTELLGGTLQVTSAPGQGTEVTIRVPVLREGGDYGPDKDADRGRPPGSP